VQLKHATTLGNEETENLKRVLSIILVKAKYPAEFDFETKDDFESQFLAYRGVRAPKPLDLLTPQSPQYEPN
jgi:hypothetical protein